MLEKTAHIRGLEIDLKKQAAAMTALHLDEVFTILHDANDAYRELSNKLADRNVEGLYHHHKSSVPPLITISDWCAITLIWLTLEQPMPTRRS